jgi:hypothetical protein
MAVQNWLTNEEVTKNSYRYNNNTKTNPFSMLLQNLKNNSPSQSQQNNQNTLNNEANMNNPNI